MFFNGLLVGWPHWQSQIGVGSHGCWSWKKGDFHGSTQPQRLCFEVRLECLSNSKSFCFFGELWKGEGKVIRVAARWRQRLKKKTSPEGIKPLTNLILDLGYSEKKTPGKSRVLDAKIVRSPFFMDADVLQLCNLRTSVDSLESSECLLSWMSNVSLVYLPAICVSNNLHHLTISYYPILLSIDPYWSYFPPAKYRVDHWFFTGSCPAIRRVSRTKGWKAGPWDCRGWTGQHHGGWTQRASKRSKLTRLKIWWTSVPPAEMAAIDRSCWSYGVQLELWVPWYCPLGCNSDKYGFPCAMMPWCHGQSSFVNCPNIDPYW